MTALAINDDHRALAEVARSLLTERDALGSARDALEGSTDQPAFWKEAVALGWPGLHIDEAHGGQGYGLLEAAIIAEEFGRCAAPGPFLPTAVVSAAIQGAGDDDQKRSLLPDLASASRTAAFSLGGDLARTDFLDGGPVPMVGADRADLLAVVVGDDLVVIEAEAAGVSVVQSDELDPSRPMCAVRFEGVPALAVVVGGAVPARRALWTLAAAEAVGGMASCTEASAEYARAREQFGRPIGGFMAVKHHLVDMLADAELGAAAAWAAARPADDDAEAQLAAALAATQAIAGYRRVAARAIQVHGGIGYTWEHVTNLHLRRAAGLSVLVAAAGLPADAVVSHWQAGVRCRAGLDLPPPADEHRRAVRAFVEELRRTPEQGKRTLFSRSGYLVPHWPRPFGRGADPLEQLVIDEELEGIDRPGLGLGEWLIPSLLQHGTPGQIDRWMWPSLDGDLRWCQLFSEPGAGSDAAAVSTRGTRVEGGWSVTGQKLWSSNARECDVGLATVRTNTEVAKHKGITMMLIDMHGPGVEVRPITELSGEQLFNEVFLDEAFVPDDAVIGPVDGGWRVARAALGNERVSIGQHPASMGADALVERLARGSADRVTSRALGVLLAEGHALRMLNVRSAARLVEDGSFGVEGSLAKLVGAEHAQRVVDLGLDIAGVAATLGDDPALVHDYFFARCLTIAGGTSEILRSQIGERVLGLPREPLAESSR